MDALPIPSEKSYWEKDNPLIFDRKYENAERFSLNPSETYTKVRPDSKSGTKHKHSAIENKIEYEKKSFDFADVFKFIIMRL